MTSNCIRPWLNPLVTSYHSEYDPSHGDKAMQSGLCCRLNLIPSTLLTLLWTHWPLCLLLKYHICPGPVHMSAFFCCLYFRLNVISAAFPDLLT